MANESTCIRCGKPCASGEVMCASCNQWLNEQEAAEKAAAERTVSAEAAQKTAAAVKQCVHCDGMIPAAAEFCPHCGQNQKAEVKKPAAAANAPAERPAEKPAEPPVPQQKNTVQPQREKPKEKMSGQKGLIIGLSILILLLLAALAVILVLSLKDPTPGETGTEGQENAGTGLGSFEPGSGIVVPGQDAAPETEQTPETGEETAGQETEQNPAEPVAVACRNCGVAITTEDAVCPYCEWDQSMEPEEDSDEPLTAAVGYTEDVEDWTTVAVVSTSETSVVSQSGTYDNTAASAVDGDLTTSWQEGASGYGIGESIQLDFDGMHQIRGFALWLGNWRSDSLYEENCVPKMLNIYIDNRVLTVEFPQEKSCQYVVFSEPVPADYVMIEISSVYAGTKYDDTCIADVLVYGDPE